jgi:hypothetical protein
VSATQRLSWCHDVILWEDVKEEGEEEVILWEDAKEEGEEDIVEQACSNDISHLR